MRYYIPDTQEIYSRLRSGYPSHNIRQIARANGARSIREARRKGMAVPFVVTFVSDPETAAAIVKEISDHYGLNFLFASCCRLQEKKFIVDLDGVVI
jgi:hypothetical protein